MSIISTILGTVFTSVLGAGATILCGPCSNDFKRCIEDLYGKFKSFIEDYFKPISDEDLNNLRARANQIITTSPSKERDQWISDANIVMATQNLSSNRNVGLKSCCLICDKCLRCDMRRKVKKLLEEGNLMIAHANQSGCIPVVPDLNAGEVEDLTLTEAMRMLREKEVGRIGIWGAQGVGKTTVVQTLNNRLRISHPQLFSFIVFVPQTENFDLKYVQKTISERLNLQVDETMGTERTADCIYGTLENEKFLLILDNVSEFIDLASIGIPEKRGMSKIVLTSRSKNVCLSMDAKPIYMNVEPFYGVYVGVEKFVKFSVDVIQEYKRLPQALSNLLVYKSDLVRKYQYKMPGPLSERIGWCINKLEDLTAT